MKVNRFFIIGSFVLLPVKKSEPVKESFIAAFDIYSEWAQETEQRTVGGGREGVGRRKAERKKAKGDGMST